MLRAVADTNVVVSALLWRGAPHRLFSRIESERICFYTSRALIAELAGVLRGANSRAPCAPRARACRRSFPSIWRSPKP
ncbi:MAG: PIN domain-containing protein [Burkholderiales bacterium]